MTLPKIKTLAALSLILPAMALTGCGSDNNSAPVTGATDGGGGSTAITELTGDYSTDVTLDANTVYKINGEVNFLEGTTLTIPAGTTLYGATGASYLAINRGAKIMAEGTAAAPIVFTSAQDIAGTAGTNDQGQWGGLTILGQSINNKGERTYEAGTQKYGPKDGTAIAADNSGVLKYVIVKHTGFEVEKDKELNGLSLASVGSGTVIENVAIIGSADDGIEFWGGTVNVKNLYVENAGDDSLDTDQGYTGTMDNVFVEQFDVDDEEGSRAIEADGKDKTGNVANEMSIPKLKNATLITKGRAIRLREGTGYDFDNVQVQVKSTSASLPAAATAEETVDYYNAVAAVRISDQDTLDFAQITTSGDGIAIVNNAVDPNEMGTVTGNSVTDGFGLYYQNKTTDANDAFTGSTTETMDYFRDTVSDNLAVDVKDALDGNTVTGADLTQFSWVLAHKLANLPVETLQGDITANKTLTANKTYAIFGEVNVVAPAVLTIEKGTTLFGVTGSSYLAVNRGAQIIADGTAAEPIVFTSAQDMAGQNSGDEQGQWGGLTILGSASANKGERTYEAGTQLYGPTNGTNNGNDAESSGVLRYVAVKYSGYEVEKDKELNGISLAAVGSGTVIENIASIGSADDGIELWGGTVSIDGLYVYNAGDDSIDTDQGYIGTIQNVYAEQNVVDDETGSRIIEADGKDTNGGGSPQSKVTMKDALLKSVGRAVRLREGTDYEFDNVKISVESGAATAAFRMSDTAATPGTSFSVSGGGLEIDNTVAGGTTYYLDSSKTPVDDQTEKFVTGAGITLQGVNVTEYDRSWIPGWTK